MGSPAKFGHGVNYSSNDNVHNNELMQCFKVCDVAFVYEQFVLTLNKLFEQKISNHYLIFQNFA